MSTGQNIIIVLFCDSLTYSGILFLSVMRTWTLIRHDFHSLKYRKQFTAFYILVWITLSFTILLYWLIAAGVVYAATNLVAEVALYFLPNIFMVLCYALLYHILQKMMTASKLDGSGEYANRFRVDRCAKVVTIVVTVLICTFVAV